MKKKEEKNEKNNNNNLCLYIMPNVFYFARTDESQCGLDDRVERKRDTNKIVKIHLVMIVTGACMWISIWCALWSLTHAMHKSREREQTEH